MSLRVGIILSLAILAAGNHAEAKNFDFKSGGFATYVRGEFGTSNISDSAYAGANPSGVTDDQKVSTAYAGEFGVVIAGSKMNLRIGAEYLLPQNLSSISGSNASGTKLYTLDSKVTALIPMADLEFLLHSTPTSHFLVGVGGGVGLVTLDNNYTFTSAGTTQFNPTQSFEEKASGQATVAQIYGGYEFIFTDSATLTFDLGYRYFQVSSLTATQAATTFNGAEASGGQILNTNGSDRALNLGGIFAGLSFRFYINL